MNLNSTRRHIRQANFQNQPTNYTRQPEWQENYKPGPEHRGEFIGTLIQTAPGILTGCWNGLRISAVLDKSMKYRLFAFSEGGNR